MTNEHKLKISKALLSNTNAIGRRSEETKKKISEARRGRKYFQETRRKISESMRNRKKEDSE